MNVKQAKQIPIQQVLECLGFLPVKERHGEWWYLSPLRAESEAPFKLSQDGKAWYDHGTGRGGNLLDFLMAYFQTDLHGALQRLEDLQTMLGANVTTLSSPVAAADHAVAEPILTVTKLQPLTNRALTRYLQQRGIPLAVARPYLQEMHYRRAGKPYFALAFANDSGGYELRNRYFKGTQGAKDITVLQPPQGETDVVALFEGFMDFLSAITLAQHPPQMRVLVMNSASLKDKVIEKIRSWDVKTVYLYLDGDETGRRLTTDLQTALADLDVRDMAILYVGYKDLNDWWSAGNRHPIPGGTR